MKPIEEIAQKWQRNSLRAYPDWIQGIISAYFQDKQSLKWATSTLKNEDHHLVSQVLDTFRMIDPIKYDALSQGLKEE